jgi:hypothetical protein
LRPDPIIGPDMNSKATAARDAGLELIRRINRWMIAGAIALTGVISLLAAGSFHGHSASAATTSQSSQGSGSSTSSSSSSSDGSGLAQPAQAPSSSSGSSAPAPVVSGGS